MTIGEVAGYRIRMVGDSNQVSDYLMHYGILGQRWGLRRFQNEDRSLTEAGKRRYGVGIINNKEKNNDDSGYVVRTQADREKTAKRIEKRISETKKKLENANDALYNIETQRYSPKYYSNSKAFDVDRSKAYLEKNKIDQELKDLQILKKINGQKRISQHRLNLEQKYREKGMTEEQAKVAAYKRDRTEKMIAIAGITTMAVASAWLYKNHMADIDKVISKDTMLQNLSTDPNKGIQDAFYATYDPRDNQKYLHLFGGDHIQGAANNPIARIMGVADKVDVQKMTVQALSEMKIAGANVGRDTANELIQNNQSYRQAIKDMLDSHGVGSDKGLGLLMEMNGIPGYRNVQDAIYNGKALNKHGYNFLNRMLVDHSDAGEVARSGFFGALRRKGYDGAIDLNDIFNSGYDAKSPVIIFNGGKKLGNITRATIDPDTLQVGKIYEKAKVYGKQILNIAVPGVAVSKGSEKAGEVYRQRKAEKLLIKEYRKEHPNTKMNDNQILKSVLG